MNLREKLELLSNEMNDKFIGMHAEIEGLILSLLSQSNMIMIGAPGSAKTALVKKFIQYFDKSITTSTCMLNAFSTPDDIFGPVSTSELFKSDKLIRKTENRMPSVNFSFVDEPFHAGKGILNNLLKIMIEHKFEQDGVDIDVPLWAIVSASNLIPSEEDRLQALYDRYLLRYMVRELKDPGSIKRLLMTNINYTPSTSFNKKEVEEARKEMEGITFPQQVVDMLYNIKISLESHNIPISPRRLKLSSGLVKAVAWRRGRTEADLIDMEILKQVFWAEQNHIIPVEREIIQRILPIKHQIYEKYIDLEGMYNDIIKTHKEKKDDESLRLTQTFLQKVSDATTFIVGQTRQEKEASLRREYSTYLHGIEGFKARIFRQVLHNEDAKEEEEKE
jgi:MoxR-like ATPase